jgi:hypothetical protein
VCRRERSKVQRILLNTGGIGVERMIDKNTFLSDHSRTNKWIITHLLNLYITFSLGEDTKKCNRDDTTIRRGVQTRLGLNEVDVFFGRKSVDVDTT